MKSLNTMSLPSGDFILRRRQVGLTKTDMETGETYQDRWLESSPPGSFSLSIILLVGVVCLELFLVVPVHFGKDENTTRVGAVVADHIACSKVGRSILLRGGSAVDAAIATLLCTGVRQPQSMGMGGGCVMVIYDKKNNRAITINGREAVPGNYVSPDHRRGSITIGIPGELRAYKAAHDLYGRLPWKELFLPSIKMATKGHKLSRSTARSLSYTKKLALNDTKYNVSFYDIFGTETPSRKEPTILPMIGRTLKRVAEQGPDYIYNSDTTIKLVKEIKESGGVATVSDFANYQAIVQEATEFDVKGMKLYTSDHTSAGSVLGLMLKMVENMHLTRTNISTAWSVAKTLHYWIEMFKIACGYFTQLSFSLSEDRIKDINEWQKDEVASKILQKIGDKSKNILSYMPDGQITPLKIPDHTSHVSVLAPDGDAVSVTSSIGFYFGSGFISKSTGLIMNNHVQDYICPGHVRSNTEGEGSKTNENMSRKLQPGERRFTAMAPVIMVEDGGKVRVVSGGSGAMKILSSQTQILSRVLWLDESLESAFKQPRFHYLFETNQTFREKITPQDWVDELKLRGHETSVNQTHLGSAMVIYVHENGTTEAVADSRKPPGKGLLVIADDK